MFAFSTPFHYGLHAARNSRVMRSPLKRMRHGYVRVQAYASVSREDVEKTARLACLSLSEDEIEKVTPEFQKIIDFVDRMSDVDIEGVEPMARPQATHNVTREDKPTMFSDVDAIMNEVPIVERDFVRVPKITSESSDEY